MIWIKYLCGASPAQFSTQSFLICSRMHIRTKCRHPHRKAKPKGAAAMKELHFNVEEVTGLHVQEIAEWRWRKAEEFPDDPRNLEAAKELERLAAEIAQLNGSALHNRILELIDIVSEQGADDEAIDTIESTEAELHRVGFGGGFRTGAELLEWYRNELEDRLRESI
jgi:hypothetical protein